MPACAARRLDACPDPARRPVPPAGARVVVVRARVDDRVLPVVGERVGMSPLPAEGPLEDVHPRDPERLAEPVDRERDVTEVLTDQRERPELRRRGVEQRLPGPAQPATAPRRAVADGDRPVRHVPAEVVEAGPVEELQRASESLHPPAVAVLAKCSPAVRRVPPELAGPREEIGRHARHERQVEVLRVRRHVRALALDVEREVADDADPALVRVGAKRAPLALEADLRRDLARVSDELRPAVDPVGVASPERVDLPRAHALPRGGQELAGAGERGEPRVRGPERVRRRRAAGPASRTDPLPRASRRSGTPRARAGRRGATSGGGGRRSSASSVATRRRTTPATLPAHRFRLYVARGRRGRRSRAATPEP